MHLLYSLQSAYKKSSIFVRKSLSILVRIELLSDGVNRLLEDFDRMWDLFGVKFLVLGV
jgi:hypothetical protein